VKTPVNLKDKVGADLPDPPYRTGGPAFPAHPSDANADIIGSGGYGLSLLDFFAAHVITGLASRQNMSLDELKTDGAGTAYWVAAVMVDVRNRLPIEITPVPTTEKEEVPPEPVEEETELRNPPPPPESTPIVIPAYETTDGTAPA
jgi:hypothetical protein